MSVNTNNPVTFTMPTGGVDITASFTQTSTTYSYTWYARGLPSGTMWGITIGSTTQWSSSDSLTWTGLSGTQSWSVDTPSGYTANPSSGAISGTGSTTITFTGTPQIQVSINPQPTSGTAPLKVTLYAGWWGAPSGATYNYTIDWGDGSTPTTGSTTSTTGTFYHTYNSTSSYTITVTASASGAQTGSASATVTANTPPPTTYTVTFGTSGSGSVTPSGTQYYNPGATVNITASPASGWSFVQWQVSGNISIANSTSPSTTATVNGNGSVTAIFEQVPTSYVVTFNESGLPSGVQWTVTVGGSVYSANSGQPINIQCSSGQTISYTVNMVVVGGSGSTETCYYYPNGQTSVSGTASCGGSVTVTYKLHACYRVGMT